ncbi:hypothetical protein D3C74_278610 [compost metagenome]
MRIQRPADPCPFDRRSDVYNPAESGRAFEAIHLKSFVGGLQQPLDVFQIGDGLQRFRRFFSERRLGIGCQLIYNFSIFHGFKNFLVQVRSQLPSGYDLIITKPFIFRHLPHRTHKNASRGTC